MQRRVALIPSEEWDKNDPVHIAKLIQKIEDEFNKATALAQAFPVDFTFESFARVMRMVGIDDDSAHLRDPKLVRAFLDDCEELRDKLGDFIDYARELSGGANHAGVMRLAAEKIIKELDRCRDTTHARARRLVGLGHELERFAKHEANRADLREPLAQTLDDGLALMRQVTRKHFGPAYAALAPLTQLTLDHVDQDAAIALLDDKIRWLEGLGRNDPDFIALDVEGIAVFNDMLCEARDLRAAMAEATAEDFRAMLESKLAESLGGTGLALTRFVSKSAKAADRATDELDKRAKRVKSLADILKLLGLIGTAG